MIHKGGGGEAPSRKKNFNSDLSHYFNLQVFLISLDSVDL